MGFYPEPTHIRLKFTDPKYAGLEVTAESINVGMMVELMSMAGYGEAVNSANNQNIKELTGTMKAMFDTFGDALVEWNIEDKYKNPVPADRSGVYKQEPGFVMTLIMYWMDALSAVDTPLPKGSNSGETSLMGSLPMETLSQNQPN